MDIEKISVSILVCLVIWLGCDSTHKSSINLNDHPVEITKNANTQTKKIIEKCIAEQTPIDFVKLTNHKRFKPSAGPDGAECIVTKSEPMFSKIPRAPGQKPFVAGDSIYLYPFTNAESVIVLSHENGNWIEGKFYDLVKEAVEQGRMNAAAH